MLRTELVDYCNEQLKSDSFKDYCPNGLQIEGKEEITTIISGVTASMALIEAAVQHRADLILVHHGMFWRGEAEPITGMKYRRIKALLDHEINLLAYHLPLDFHPQWGNNVQLAARLGIDHEPYDGAINPLLVGTINETTGAEFSDLLSKVLQRSPLHIPVERPVRTLALCTGAAQQYIDKALALNADAYISGEVSEHTWHFARENNIHYFAAGHHCTERYGVMSLGDHLAEKFALNHTFVDLYNPV